MKHQVRICVSKEPQPNGVGSCRSITLREKLLNRLLGNKQKLMVLVPGESVAAVTICTAEGGDGSE